MSASTFACKAGEHSLCASYGGIHVTLCGCPCHQQPHHTVTGRIPSRPEMQNSVPPPGFTPEEIAARLAAFDEIEMERGIKRHAAFWSRHGAMIRQDIIEEDRGPKPGRPPSQ